MRKFVLAVLLVFAFASLAQAGPLIVAAGAGYKKFVTELAGTYEQQSGQKLELVFGNMGQVVAQAKGSGKIQLIIGEQGFLQKTGLAFASFHELGRGALVLAWPKGRGVTTLDDLVKPEIKRLAMPDPQKAIYGAAGAEALARSGLSAKVRDKLLVVATVPQVTSYLVLGEVDAGLTNLTDVMDLGQKIGGWSRVDERLYAPIVIGAGVLADARDQAAVSAFTVFLASPKAREIARKHGL
ncbi:MAG: molybdate ABC transporter substrate-binding protein [Humidesulfovibrio sp.]|nr:molybdate ABC transporter substrate-binding protein [Humidesulfovibrio sp.]